MTRVVFFDNIYIVSEKEELKKEETIEIVEPASKQSFFSRVKNKYRDRQAKKLEQIQQLEQDDKKVEEKLEETNKEVTEFQSRDKKKKIKNILFFIFNIVLVAGILMWNIFTTEDFEPFIFSEINLLYVLVVLLFLCMVIVVDVISIHRMIYRKTLRSRWALSYKSLSILRYYDAVTPLASGGQAFMVSYLTGRDVSASTSLSIPIAKLLFQQIAWLFITFVCLIISFTNNMTTLVSAASIIGFVLALLMVVIILFFSLSKKLGVKIVSWGLKFLTKIHIIKDYDKHYTKVLNFVEDYQNIMKEYSKSKWDVIFQILMHIIRFVIFFSIPFFVCCIFKGFDGSKFGEFFIYTALIDLASSFIPLPGGTGMNEITFTALFKDYLGGKTFWALLIWRFCSYYFYLLQGIGIMTYDTVYGNRKYRWVKKKFDLQNESEEFRRVQIENFRQERSKRRKKQKKSAITE